MWYTLCVFCTTENCTVLNEISYANRAKISRSLAVIRIAYIQFFVHMHEEYRVCHYTVESEEELRMHHAHIDGTHFICHKWDHRSNDVPIY